MAHILDDLKKRTVQQRAGAVSPDPGSGGLIREGASDAERPITNPPTQPASSGKASESANEPDPSKPTRNQARAGPSTVNAAGGPARPSATAGRATPAYYAYWIGQLRTLEGLSPDAAAAAVHAAIRHAPANRRPPTEDARLLVLAGGQALPYREVIGWLTLRAALNDHEGVVDPEVARYWLRQLGTPAATLTTPDPAWSARCRHIAGAAVKVGQGLSPATVAALAAHPEAARGYLRCAGAKARLSEVDARVVALEAAGNQPDHPTGHDQPTAPAQPAARRGSEQSPPVAGVDPNAAEPPSATSTSKERPLPIPPTTGSPPVFGATPGAGVGLALGNLAGGLVGGVVGGLKAGAAQAWSSAARTGAGETLVPLTPDWFRNKVTDVRNHAREHRARHAVEAAERGLAEFAKAARHLHQHPTLAAFWREVDQQAASRFRGDRTAVLQEMAAHSSHPLRALFERQARADPDVALRYEQAHAAFARLQTAWQACAHAHRQVGPGWAPSPEQTRTLRAACRQVPPAPDRPALVEQAERLLRALAQAVRQAFQRNRAPTAGPSTAPAP